MHKRNRRALVTYGWCRTAYQSAKALASAGYDVYVVDSSPYAMTRFSHRVKGFRKVPDPYECKEAYSDAIKDICLELGIDVVLPVHEDSLILAESDLRLGGRVVLAAPEFNSIFEATDKFSFYNKAKDASVPVPNTMVFCNFLEAERWMDKVGPPYVVKDRFGNGGKNVLVASSRSAVIDEISDRLSRGKDEFDFIIQEYKKGSIYGACFFAVEGLAKEVFVEKYCYAKEGEVGSSVLRRRVESKTIEEYARRLAFEYAWNGLGHFDFIVDEEVGEVVALEFNPRIWGGVSLSIACGYNFPLAQVLHYEGEDHDRAFNKKDSGGVQYTHWVLGELIRHFSLLKRNPFAAAWRIASALSSQIYVKRFDDLSWSDPLPFLLECLDYWVKHRKEVRGARVKTSAR